MPKFSRRSFLRASAVGAAGALSSRLPTLSASGEYLFPHISTKTRQRKDLNIAYISQQLAAQSNQRVLSGFEAWVKRAGLPWNVAVTNAEASPEKLAATLEEAVSKNVDAIVVGFGTLTGARGALASVGRAGIPLITVDSGYFPPAICDIASNNYVIGAQMGAYMIQRLLAEGKTQPGILRISANFHHGTRKRGKVLDNILSESENIRVLGDQVVQYDGFFEKTLNTVNDWLSRFGDEVDAIWTPWDEPGMAAAQALLGQGKTVKDAFVVAADGHPPAIEEMRKDAYPLVATCAQAFELWGALAGSFIDEIVGKGRPTREVVPVPQIDLPAPFVVKGVNMPEEGKQPWDTVDFYALLMNQAKGQANQSQ